MKKMKPYYVSSVFIFLLLFSLSIAHSESQNGNGNNNNGPLFGSVMRYFGESETGYGLPSSGLFEDVETSQQQVSMCLPNFEVSVGSIIRTKDSQALGAHYLNETDLGSKSRDECLKLCCKVSRCNVAVFEEKNSGSCYLFDCGSLEDFRCKFTTQSHYVSAILRHRDPVPAHNGNPSSPEHSGSIMNAHINSHSHNQHEDELSQLRDSDKAPGPQAAAVVPAAAAGLTNLADASSKNKQAGGGEITHGSGGTASSSSTTSPVVLSDVNSGDLSHRCSRWQFECKSSGECIAIYNVCDAIPNCPDGSDESPELHCPPPNNGYSAVGGVAPSNTSNSKGSTPHHSQDTSLPNHHPQPPVPIPVQDNKMYPVGNNPPSVITGTKNSSPYRQTDEYPVLPPGNSNIKQIGPVGSGMNARKDQSAIFKHPGGIMDDLGGNHQHGGSYGANNPFWKANANYDYGNGESPPAYPIVPPPQYPNNINPYGTGYANTQYQYNGYANGPPQQPQPQNLPVIPPGQQQYSMNMNYNPQSPYYNQQVSQPLQGNNAMIPVSVNGQPTGGVIQPSNVRNTGVPQPATNIVNPSNPQVQPQANTPKPNIAVSQGAPQIISNNNSKISLSKLENDFMKSLKAQSLQGGSTDIQSEELSPHTAGAGAVFIFILGLGMSIVMVIIVGCRLRRVGRRQRGKNRLDPDYLVDGMYL